MNDKEYELWKKFQAETDEIIDDVDEEFVTIEEEPDGKFTATTK